MSARECRSPAATALQSFAAEAGWVTLISCGVVLSLIAASPSWPLLLSPQAHSVPLARIATVWLNPEAETSQFLAPPATSAGVLRGVTSDASPSCPKLLSPQAHRLPLERSATVKALPGSLLVQLTVSVATRTGTVEEIWVSFPNWPVPLLPQAWISPLASSASEWVPPAAIDATLLNSTGPLTTVGELLAITVPSPS